MIFFKKVFLLLSYCPLQIFAWKTCSQDIATCITASSFKLGQLIEDNEKITWSKIKKKVIFLFFFSYCPLQNWAFETCNQDVSEIIIASSFKHGQLVEDDE